jgi:hypothetical protein
MSHGMNTESGSGSLRPLSFREFFSARGTCFSSGGPQTSQSVEPTTLLGEILHCEHFQEYEKLPRMGQKKPRVTKWAGTSPAIATCDSCGRQFKVPTTYLSKAKDAHASLQDQFDRHNCQTKTMIAK